MNVTADKVLVDMIFAGLYQAVFAALGAGFISLREDRGIWWRRFALFNLFLFGWSILGDAAWNHLTFHKLAVLDDAPVWTAVFPVGRYILGGAAGSGDAWQLGGSTTLSDLKWLWVFTVAPVWALAVTMSWGCRFILPTPSANVFA